MHGGKIFIGTVCQSLKLTKQYSQMEEYDYEKVTTSP